MPLYSYLCQSCGPFDDFRPMADFEKPAECPHCEQASPRLASAAQLNLMASNNRTAHRLNEKNANEPRVGRAEEKKKHHHGHKHDHKHHGHSHHNHSHASDRPWMVGH